MNINKILLTGNLVTDPELKQINGGKSVVNVSVANNEYYAAESGDRQKNTTFVELQIWGKPAEALSRLAKKGQEIYVEGQLSTRVGGSNDNRTKTSSTTVGVSKNPCR